MTAEIIESVEVAAPADQVFAAATDWARQGEWMFATRVRATRGGGHGTGAEIAARTGFGPFAFTDTMTITEWDPPRICRVRHTGTLVRGTAAFAVEPRADGSSVFIWSEILDLPLGRVGEWGFRLTRGTFVFFLRRSLRAFAVFAAERS